MAEPSAPESDPWEVVLANRRLAYLLARGLWRRFPVLSRLGSLEDLEQECLLAMHQAAQSYDPRRGTKFGTHAGAVVPRRVLRRASLQSLIRVPATTVVLARRGAGGQRAATAKKAMAATKAPCPIPPGHNPPAPPAPEDERENLARLRAALGRLPEGMRSLVADLYGLDGRPVKTQTQLAAKFGVSKGAMSQRWRKASARLRQELGLEGGQHHLAAPQQ